MSKRATSSKRGPLSPSESGKRKLRNSALRKEHRAAYLREVRERAEWGIAMLKLCEAMGWPVVFRKSDLIALRK